MINFNFRIYFVVLLLSFSLFINLDLYAIKYVDNQIKNSISYEDKDLGLKIEYPSDWLIDETEMSNSSIILYKIDRLAIPIATFNISMNHNIENISLVEFIKNYIKKISSYNMSGFIEKPGIIIDNITTFNQIDFHNNTGYIMEYTFPIEFLIPQYGSIKELKIWIAMTNNIYTLTYTANQEMYEKILPEIKEIISSVSFIK